MSRKALIRSDFLPYHVTVRANNREIFWPGPERMWGIFNKELYLATLTFGIEVHAFVMMPNHIHLMVTTPKEDLGKVMGCFLSYVTRTANLISGRSGRIFGSRYHWSLINSGHYYAHALKYVYRNPVKAKLVNRVEHYQFSTLHGLLGYAQLEFPLHYPRCGHGISLVPASSRDLLEWLNRPFSNEVDLAIRRGFRRAIFSVPRNRNTRDEPAWVKSLI